MKSNKQAVCPGCSRHCPMGAEHCKYGRRYFARQAEAEPQQTYKWEKYVQKQGLVWQLLMTARKVKKALRSRKMTEEQLLAALGDGQQLYEWLQKVDAAVEKVVSPGQQKDIQ